MDEINNENCTVIGIGPSEVILFGTYLNESNVFTDSDSVYGVNYKDSDKLFNIKYSDNLNKTITEHNGTDIYLVKHKNWENDLIDNNTEPCHIIGKNYFYKYS